MRLSFVPAVAILALVAQSTPLPAQDIVSRYTRAEALLPWHVQAKVSGNELEPRWLGGPDGDRFWFRGLRGLGSEFILVDPVRGTRAPAFDHDRLAAALSVAADTSYTGAKLPFTNFDFVSSGRSIQFQVADSARFTCDIVAYRCTGSEKATARPRDEIRSPDGKWAAFSRDENLWVRATDTGQEIQLSTDGEANWGYTVMPEGCCQEITTSSRRCRAQDQSSTATTTRSLATRSSRRGRRTSSTSSRSAARSSTSRPFPACSPAPIRRSTTSSGPRTAHRCSSLVEAEISGSTRCTRPTRRVARRGSSLRSRGRPTVSSISSTARPTGAR